MLRHSARNSVTASGVSACATTTKSLDDARCSAGRRPMPRSQPVMTTTRRKASPGCCLLRSQACNYFQSWYWQDKQQMITKATSSKKPFDRLDRAAEPSMVMLCLAWMFWFSTYDPKLVSIFLFVMMLACFRVPLCEDGVTGFQKSYRWIDRTANKSQLSLTIVTCITTLAFGS